MVIKYRELIELIKENPKYIYKEYNVGENNLVIFSGDESCGIEVSRCHFENGELEFDNGISKQGVKGKVIVRGSSGGKVKSIEFIW